MGIDFSQFSGIINGIFSIRRGLTGPAAGTSSASHSTLGRHAGVGSVSAAASASAIAVSPSSISAFRPFQMGIEVINGTFIIVSFDAVASAAAPGSSASDIGRRIAASAASAARVSGPESDIKHGAYNFSALTGGSVSAVSTGSSLYIKFVQFIKDNDSAGCLTILTSRGRSAPGSSVSADSGSGSTSAGSSVPSIGISTILGVSSLYTQCPLSSDGQG